MVTVAETHIGHILHIGNGFIDVYHYRLELYMDFHNADEEQLQGSIVGLRLAPCQEVFVR